MSVLRLYSSEQPPSSKPWPQEPRSSACSVSRDWTPQRHTRVLRSYIAVLSACCNCAPSVVEDPHTLHGPPGLESSGIHLILIFRHLHRQLPGVEWRGPKRPHGIHALWDISTVPSVFSVRAPTYLEPLVNLGFGFPSAPRRPFPLAGVPFPLPPRSSPSSSSSSPSSSSSSSPISSSRLVPFDRLRLSAWSS